MQAIMIIFDQAHYDHIVEALRHTGCRGFTAWPQVTGRGTHDGEPHMGSHAWPALSQAIMAVVPDDRTDSIMERLRILDEERPKLGLRAFQWPVTNSI